LKVWKPDSRSKTKYSNHQHCEHTHTKEQKHHTIIMVEDNIVVGQQRKYSPPSLSLSPSPLIPQTQTQPTQSLPMAMVVPSNVNNPATTTLPTQSIIRTKAEPTLPKTVEPTTTTSMSMSMSIETTSAASASTSLPKISATTTPIHTGVTINNSSKKKKNNKRKRPIPQTVSSQRTTTTSTDTADNYNDKYDDSATANGTGNNNTIATTSISQQQQQQQQQNTTQQQQQQHHRVGKDGEPLSDKKIRRLEKNRLSARECRRRKREATENMQRQIHLLEGENLRLRLQLQVGEEAEQTNHQKQIDSTKILDELVRSGNASESEIYAKIEEYKEQFADYGRDRRSAMEFHLRNVERLLMPTQTTSFIMNTLKGTISTGSTGTSNDTTATATTTTSNGTTIDGKEGKVKSEENTEGRVRGGINQSTISTSASASASTLLPTPMPIPLPSSVAAAAAIMTSPTKYDSNESPSSSVLQHATPSIIISSAATATATITASNVATAPASVSSATPDVMMSIMPPQNSKELFITLVKILEVTPEQAAVLKDSRSVAQEMDETLKETLICLTELRGRLAQCGHDLDTEFNSIRQILTPSQSAKFLVWVAQNKACMHMLNELWSKKYNPLSSSSTSTTHSKTTSKSTETSTLKSMPVSIKSPPSTSSSFEE